MDEEEAEGLLRRLRADLAEFGGGLPTLARSAVPEDGRPVDVRAELRLVLDEYEALLVAAPKMVALTMSMLKARSMTVQPDWADSRFALSRTELRGAIDVEGVTVTADDLDEWLKIAVQSSDLIMQLRGRLDDQRS